VQVLVCPVFSFCHRQRQAGEHKTVARSVTNRRASRQQGHPDQYVGRILRSHENKTTTEVHEIRRQRRAMRKISVQQRNGSEPPSAATRELG
jgi:hypothetical protein